MSPMDARQPSRSSNNHNPSQPPRGVIDLTSSSPDESDEENWEDARQSLSPQKPEVKSNRQQLASFVDPRPAGVLGNMPMHHRRPAELANPDMMVFGGANALPAQNPAPVFGLPRPVPPQPPQAPNPQSPIQIDDDVWENYILDDRGDVEAVPEPLHHPPINGYQPPPPEQAQSQMATQQVQPVAQGLSMHSPNNFQPAVESKDSCIAMLMVVFPGICPDHVSELYEETAQTSGQLITHILDQIDKGTQYPKAKDKQKSLKRKRAVDEDEEAVKKYGAVDRVVPNTVGGVRPYIRSILMQEFSVTPAVYIDATLSQNNYRLFSAYRVLEEAHRTYDSIPPPYNKIKTARKMDPYLREAAVASTISKPDSDGEKIEVLEELQAARRIKKKADQRREVEVQKKIDEEANVRKAEAEGTMAECGCCCCDYPLNRMVHCDSEEEIHWFCRDCARTTAEVEIGKSKYDLRCMSTDKCEAGFAMNQRVQFLDEKTRVALERNEQESNLRLAGIENLESCPFCPFAAEYPPVEIDREFRCQAEDCERVSCRLCKMESHIPKSCEEFAKENGLSIRRQIEEAMSAAMIRKCNKCNTPFVKEEGCNKMTCTRNGCFNIQCYVCSKSCTYDHFNDPGRGGKVGNCPLFESVEQRHEDEVKKAEEEALEKVLADHPEYTAEDLKVKMSENVKQDDDKRKAMDPRARQDAMLAAARNGLGRLPGQPIPMPMVMPLAGNWRAMAGHVLGPHPFPPPPPPPPGMPGLEDRPYVPIRERLGLGAGPGQLPRRAAFAPYEAQQLQPLAAHGPAPIHEPAAVLAPPDVRLHIPARALGRLGRRAEVQVPPNGGAEGAALRAGEAAARVNVALAQANEAAEVGRAAEAGRVAIAGFEQARARLHGGPAAAAPIPVQVIPPALLAFPAVRPPRIQAHYDAFMGMFDPDMDGLMEDDFLNEGGLMDEDVDAWMGEMMEGYEGGDGNGLGDMDFY